MNTSRFNRIFSAIPRCASLKLKGFALVLGLAAFIPVSASALVITPTFDSSITGDTNVATIEATINNALAVYTASFTDPITVSITFQKLSNGLGQSNTYILDVSYASYRAALESHATTSNDATALAHLPTGSTNPVNGGANVTVSTANARALGFSANPPAGQADSTISLNTSIMNLSRTGPQDPNKFDLMSVVQHETDEALGLGSGVGSSDVRAEDLFRYNQNGARTFQTGTNVQAYFSLDGTTDLERFNQDSTGDYGDWATTAKPPQVQDAFGTPGSKPNLGKGEKTALDVIGYTPAAVPEPSTFALISLAFLFLFAGFLKRRRVV